MVDKLRKLPGADHAGFADHDDGAPVKFHAAPEVVERPVDRAARNAGAVLQFSGGAGCEDDAKASVLPTYGGVECAVLDREQRWQRLADVDYGTGAALRSLACDEPYDVVPPEETIGQGVDLLGGRANRELFAPRADDVAAGECRVVPRSALPVRGA